MCYQSECLPMIPAITVLSLELMSHSSLCDVSHIQQSGKTCPVQIPRSSPLHARWGQQPSNKRMVLTLLWTWVERREVEFWTSWMSSEIHLLQRGLTSSRAGASWEQQLLVGCALQPYRCYIFPKADRKSREEWMLKSFSEKCCFSVPSAIPILFEVITARLFMLQSQEFFQSWIALWT